MEGPRFYIIRAYFNDQEQIVFIEERLDDAERHATHLLANGANPVHVIPVGS